MAVLSYQHRRSVVLVGAVASIVLLALMGSRILQGTKDVVTYAVGKVITVPPESLTLTSKQEETLWKEHKLKPFKSRGATIFLDDKGDIRIPPDYILQLMKLRDLEELYHRYLGTIQTLCKRKLHMGQIIDGGYDICQDDEVVPKSPCLMYSFGVRDDFSFDEEVASMYGCEVHSFDPANGMQDHKHSDSVYFHSMGISDFDGVMNKVWKMRTFASIKKELGHTDRKPELQLLKIDMEGGEWNVLKDMLSKSALTDAKQLIARFSTWTNVGTIKYPDLKDIRGHLNIARALYEEGYRIFFHRRFHQKKCPYIGQGGYKWTGCMERKIEIVKIDIESGEWLSFASMLKDGVFKDIKQLITELHTWVDLPPDWTVYHRNERDYRQHLSVLRQIYEEGFRIFFLRRFDAACCIFDDGFNNERTGCNEVHFMKVK